MRLLRSRYGLYLVLAILAFESLWIALTSRYPMAFDEYFHYGVAQLHAATWSPFLTNVPSDASLYGPIARDASFLYHYLLSFPLRVLQLVTDSQIIQIISLRILNIGIALAAIVMYARLLRAIGLSWLKTNSILLFVCLIPIVPLTAGQITYDNLFLLLVGATLLLAVRVMQLLQTEKQLNAQLLTWLLISGLFTTLTKYAFLPAMLAIVIIIGVSAFPYWRQLLPSFKKWWRVCSTRTKTLVVSSLLVGSVLFAGSYAVNLVRYQTPVPKCDAVLSVDACKAYGPWYRDYLASQEHSGSSVSDVPPYVKQWFKQMMEETFFMVGAKYNDQGIVVYRSVKPLPLLLITAWVIMVIGALVLLLRSRQVWKRLDFRLLVGILLFYSLILFGRNLQFYLHTGQPVAIHGRYVLPFIIPVVGVVALLASTITLPRWLQPKYMYIPLVIAFVLFLQGGLVTYIVSTSDDWMWPQSQPAQNLNREARDLIKPLLYYVN